MACVVSTGLGLALLSGCSLMQPAGDAVPMPPAPPSAVPAEPAPPAAPPPAASAPQPDIDAAARAAAASVPRLPPLAPSDAQLVVSTSSLVAYAERLHLLSTSEIAQEIGRLAGATDGVSRLKFALALAQTHQSADTTRAMGVLQRVMAERDAPDAAYWSAIARLLNARLLEQRKLEEQLDKQAQQLRDNSRSIEGLNHKINALRAIERSINTRTPAANGSETGGRLGQQP